MNGHERQTVWNCGRLWQEEKKVYDAAKVSIFWVRESEGVRRRPLSEEASDSKRQSMSEFDLVSFFQDDQSDEAADKKLNCFGRSSMKKQIVFEPVKVTLT